MNAMAFKQAGKRAARRDYRIVALVLLILGTAALGYLVSLWPGRGVSATIAVPVLDAKPAGFSALPKTSEEAPRAVSESSASAPAGTRRAPAAEGTETEKILEAAKAQIGAKQYNAAIVTLNQARQTIQHDPQSYLLIGRALEGKADYELARDFYAAAVDHDPMLADAYFGFATASESLGDLEAAVGGMRNFLHVQPNADRQKLKIVQARSAIWEWESKLGRGAWGPTKGIPPGFSAAELKRDGRGVGIKIPQLETKQADGSMKYEVKAQDKFKLFKP